MFKKRKEYEDWLTPATVEVVRLETPSEHLARVDAQARELRDAMKTKWLLHPANRVQRIDGRSYSADAPKNVRPLPRKQRAAA